MVEVLGFPILRAIASRSSAILNFDSAWKELAACRARHSGRRNILRVHDVEQLCVQRANGCYSALDNN